MDNILLKSKIADDGLIYRSHIAMITQDQPLSIITENNIEYMSFSLDSMYDIKKCASPLIVPGYKNIISYNSKILYDFWKENYHNLMDIYPNFTYRSSINQVESFLDMNMESAFGVCAWLLGIIWFRYYSGNMELAINTPEHWRDRIERCNSGLVTKLEVSDWLMSCKNISISTYFSNQYENISLHDKYKKIIDKLIEGE